MITFVTFYMPLDDEVKNRLSRITESFRIKWKPEQGIELLFRSARLFHPECRCILLCDESVKHQWPPFVELKRCAVSRSEPIWSRLTSERDVIADVHENSHVVFLDWDILANGTLNHVFDGGFDVGLTRRFHTEMPVNAGVILAHGGRKQVIKHFFDELLGEYEKNHRENTWYGEQLSLAHLAGRNDPHNDAIIDTDYAAIRIRLFPCSQYNHSPNRARQLLGVSKSNCLLHFKGRRKIYLRDYWYARLASLERPPERFYHGKNAVAWARLALLMALNG